MTICHIINTTCLCIKKKYYLFKRAPCRRQCVSAVSKSNGVYFTIQMVHEHSFPCRLLWELLHKLMVVAVRSLPFGQKLRYPELLACMFVLFFIFYYSLVGNSNILWNLNLNISWKFDLECKGWGNICFGAAAWSWGWIKITSDYDSENDTDSGRDGLYSLFTIHIQFWFLNSFMP